MASDTATLPGIHDASFFDQLQTELHTTGPLAAVDRLCETLLATRDYQNLFYGRLMRKRVELGVSPFPTGPAAELPAETHDAYEDAIRAAAREVGGIYLSQNDFPRAWGYYRLIGEPGPVKDALANYQPGPDEDTYPLVDLAWHQQLLPKKGFDLILERHGICSAITTVSSTDLSQMPEVREYCFSRLVQMLHAQLRDRLLADLEARDLPHPSAATVPELLKGQEAIFGDDTYHVDISHLQSVAQMAIQLPAGPDLELARELCIYGTHLSRTYQGDADSPFEKTYADYLVYLDIVMGRDVEAGLAYFEAKITQELEENNTFPAEVYVNLLIKLNRMPEALAAARKAFANLPDDRGLSCPNVAELARRSGQYSQLAEDAKRTNDPLTYLAGLIAAR